MALSLTELNAITQEYIVPDSVTDNVFENDPLLAHLKVNQPRVFPGGQNFSEVFMWDTTTNAGAYDRTDTTSVFTVTEEDVSNRTTFDVKYYYANVSITKEVLQVLNVGPEAVFRQVDIRLVNGALTMSENLSLDLYNHGQDKSGDSGTDRLLNLNGLDEIVNDGTTDGWQTHTYANYGTIIRSDVSGALNSVPKNVNANITYKVMDEEYMKAVIGSKWPTLGVTTNLGFSYIKQKFQPQQRITTVDPTIGFVGLEFNKARIMVSQYCPGTAAKSPNTDSGGETLWFLSPEDFRLWITADPEFAFGFSGFKGNRDDNLLAGQLFFAGNISCVSPRTQKLLYNITG